MSEKSQATFFKEEVEQIIGRRYGNMGVYETIGALEVVKLNLLERLGKQKHVIPLKDLIQHVSRSYCICEPFELEPGVWVHNARDGREKYERQDGNERGGWEVLYD